MAKLTKSLSQLFISKVRIKCIKYFLFNPDVPIHLRGAVRELKEEINAVRRELNRLEEIGFIKSDSKGNRKYYSINPGFEFYNELLGMYHKTFGLGGALREAEPKLGEVQFVVLTDAYIKGNRLSGQDVDLVVVGQVDLDVLGAIVDDAEKKLGREINYTVLKGSEFVLRKKRRDAFVTELMIRDKVVIIGNSSELAN